VDKPLAVPEQRALSSRALVAARQADGVAGIWSGAAVAC
jgi:hypothetical protein